MTEDIEKEMKEVKKKLEKKGIQAEIIKMLDCGVIIKPTKEEHLKAFIKTREQSLNEDKRLLKELKGLLKRKKK